MSKFYWIFFAVLFTSPAFAQLQGAGGLGPAPVTTNSVTQPTLTSNSTNSTTLFVSNSIQRAQATSPIAITGGTYSFASLGTGLSVVVFASGGAVGSILSVSAGGSGYADGDVAYLSAGNYDAVVQITNAVGGVVQSGGVAVLYGGTGYSTGLQATATNAPFDARNVITLSGTLTSAATIIFSNSTYIASSRQLIVNNNTTGAFTTTVCMSNGSDACNAGPSVVLPQGTSNSTAVWLEKDGVNGIWAVGNAVLRGTTGSIGGSALLAGACSTGIVAIAGATTAMGVVATPVATPGAGFWWEGVVSSTGTVSVSVCAAIAGTPTATNYNVRVLQ